MNMKGTHRHDVKGTGRHKVEAAEYERREVAYRWRWSAAQGAVVGAGIFLLIIGGVALARLATAGIDTVIDPEVTVGIWQRTTLMAVIELVLGVTLIVSGAQNVLAEGAYRALGAITLAFGVVLFVQPATFDGILGASRNTGWLYAILGGGLLGIGFGPPLSRVRDTTQAVAADAAEQPSTTEHARLESDSILGSADSIRADFTEVKQ